MKAIQVFLLFLVFSFANSKILDESQMQNGIESESTTLPENKDKIELVDTSPNVPDPCFHADVDALCFNKTGSETKSTCECFTNQDSIVCCNVTDINKAISCVENTSSYLNIHIINAQQKEINVGQLNILKQVDSLIITDGNISKISGQFSRFSQFKCLNFSNNNITEISERALLNLNQLQVLDLSFNNLTKLPTPPLTSKVDVRGNSKISCKNVSSAIERGVEFLFKELSICEVETVYYWFNSTATVSIQHIEQVRQLDDDCPKGCKCVPDRMFYSSENRLVFIAKVDCSSLGLTEFPSKLPENTLSLNISNNSITTLSALADNSHYSEVRVLFADDNLIRSIVDLEGSTFLENFTKLSLKNNKIKDIPTYILSNLERNLNGKLVYLGGNKINCDCQTFKNIRVS